MKENLEKQRHNRVEFVAEDPALLLGKKTASNQDFGRVNMVDMNGAQVETGTYNEEEKPKKKKKKKKKKHIEEADENKEEITESTQLENTELEPTNNQRRYEEFEVNGALGETNEYQPPEDEGEGITRKKSKKKKHKKNKREHDEYEEEDKIDSNENIQEPPKNYIDNEVEGEGYGIAPQVEIEGEGENEKDKKKKKKDKKRRKEKKEKRKEEILKIKSAFMEKLISPFTEVNDLVRMFMQPLPKEVGILECTIARNKSGFNYWNPKYTLILSDGERFLLNGKKRGGNKTSNYLITLDQDNLKKKGQGFLGKLRANFMGTEFVVYDQGENPKKTKNIDLTRRELASVLYESNVLGSKGPRKMRVIIPAIDKEDNI